MQFIYTSSLIVSSLLIWMQPFQLTKLEVLGIINACPTSTVEMYLLVENCDERLQEEQVRSEKVCQHFRSLLQTL